TIDPAKAEASAPSVTVTAQPVCGMPTGSISITGITGYLYSVDGGTYSATLVYTNLAPGTHSITAKSSDGCISTATSITIYPAKAEASAPSVTVTAQPVCGTPTGSISITGTSGYVYSVDGGAYTSTLTYSNLAPGTHSITAQSPDACVSNSTTITIDPAKAEASAPSVTVTAQPVCGTPTGSISITGTTGFLYSVDGGTYSATLTYSNLAPGTHSITAQSPDACVSNSTTITIDPAKAEAIAPVVTVIAQPVCGTPTGSISITGTTGYLYSVDGGTYSATLVYTNLAPGTHSITAQSPDACVSNSTTVTIDPAKAEASAPSVTVTAQPVCGTPTGSISITATTGYLYSVDGGTYSATLVYTNLAPGTHSISAQSSDGCTSTATTVTIDPAKAEASAPSVTVTAQPVCGTPTGSISIAGTTGYLYSVDGGVYTSTLTYSNLAPGTHSITAQSSDGCISTATTITIDPAKAEASAPNVTVTAQPVCGTPTGSISIAGTTGYLYSVDGGVYTSTLTYSNLAPGTHSITAQSPDACVSNSTTVTIDPAKAEASAPSVTVTAQPVCGTPTGSISITGTTGYLYSVDGGTYSATLVYSNLAPGTHSITAKSSDGCLSNSTTVSINQQPASPSATISYSQSEYAATGSINVIRTGLSGGTYSSNIVGLSIDANTGTINLGLSKPNQTYVVTYSFGSGLCTGTATIGIKINSIPATIGYGKTSFCATGTARVTRTGPAGGTYTSNAIGLSINAATGEINLASSNVGSYEVSYAYQNGSTTASATTVVTINPNPVAIITSDLGLEVSKGELVTLTASGGTSYEWSGTDILNGQNTSVLTVRPKTTSTYTLVATNASGCTNVSQITITVKEDYKLLPNNVITPNGDGKNDTWVIKNLDYYPSNKVSIYDRAGRLVYSKKGYTNDWDGSYNGNPLNEDAYIYVIDMGSGIGVIRGAVSIIRDNN
ncbi:T9SS type B sorting domain-containing protein, partial [Pedobacter jejuensis]